MLQCKIYRLIKIIHWCVHPDTSDATGRLLFNMLGAIAQFETEIRSERQMDGISKAKEAGINFGRRKVLTTQQVLDLKIKRQNHELIKDLMKEYGLSEASAYRNLNSGSTENRL